MPRFDGKVVLVTGGTSGIGAAAAERFADEGASVVLTGRREDKGSEIAARISERGGNATFIKTDIQDANDVRNMVRRTVEIYGRLDHAINNAGIEQYLKPLVDQTEKVYEMVMNTNVKGIWLSMKEEIPEILKQGGGSIVNIASIAGVVGFPNMAIYVASKHAVIGFTKAVALEYAKEKIRVNAILPAMIETPMYDRLSNGETAVADYMASLHPVGRIGKPEEVADACLWLCSDSSSFITGASINIDGGFTAQ